jgi:hypothetical protein
MFAMFILVLFYRYDRVIASLWIQYPGTLMGEGQQLVFVGLQIIPWPRNVNNCSPRGKTDGTGLAMHRLHHH